MEIVSCFDGKGNKLAKGTMLNGTGTLNNYDIEGKLLDVYYFQDGIFKK